jgi:hypothetical protein
MRGNLPVRQPLRRQRNHQIINTGQPPLPLGHNHRLKRGLPIPRHVNLHRPSLPQHRFRPGPIPRIPPIAPNRIMLTVPEMIIHLTLQGGLQDHLGQPAQQPTLPSQLQTLSPGPINQLPNQVLIQAIGRLSGHVHRHNSHRCLSRLRNYTVEITVPLDRLPAKMRLVVTLRMRRRLNRIYPGAAVSLREGMAETLTVLRLNTPPTPTRPFRSGMCEMMDPVWHQRPIYFKIGVALGVSDGDVALPHSLYSARWSGRRSDVRRSAPVTNQCCRGGSRRRLGRG